MLKKIYLMILVSLFLSGTSIFVSAQSLNNVWQKIDDVGLQSRALRSSDLPERYSTFRLNTTALQTVLTTAPQEKYSIGEDSKIILTIPMPDGTLERFAIKDSPIMPDELAAKVPDVKTYIGQGIDNPTATSRFDFTPDGFHAIILSNRGTVYVDPYAKGDTTNHISYFTRDVENSDPFVCEVRGTDTSLNTKSANSKSYWDTSDIVNNGGTLRTFEIALAATAEYTLSPTGGGTKASAMAALTTSLNRINALYERELSMRMTFVANNMNIVFTDTLTDGYSNGNPVAMLGENQTNLDTIIGSANYDIGHVFGTLAGGGSGVAFVGVPCNSGFKAQGVSTSSNPQGSRFDINLVAHEMGHQYGSPHTFNGSTGNCATQRSASSAFEAASGSTIMGYAGICNPQNTQSSADPYFHIKTLELIVSEITNTNPGQGGSCVSGAPSGNAAPTVTVVGGNTFNIPEETPFELTASGNDTDTLTYAWEEYTQGPAGAPDPNVDAPMFRSYLPVASPIRTFPSLTYILNNNNTPPTTYSGTSASGAACPFSTFCLTAEVLSSITRKMTFQVTARDNNASGGGIASTSVDVEVTATSGPFKVTAQDSFVAPDWQTGSTQTITWNVANTTATPVSAANVDILLSTDGGQTFPFILANSTPNDGSHAITVPNGTVTTQARVKVRGSGNIFFDINNVNFTIVLGTTAASASVQGRVVTSMGRGIPRTFVRITNASTGESYNATTNQFGYFKFEDLEVGNFYTLSVSSKRYSFPNPTQSFTLNENLTGISFVGF